MSLKSKETASLLTEFLTTAQRYLNGSTPWQDGILGLLAGLNAYVGSGRICVSKALPAQEQSFHGMGSVSCWWVTGPGFPGDTQAIPSFSGNSVLANKLGNEPVKIDISGKMDWPWFFNEAGISSVLLFPIISDRTLWGFMSLEYYNTRLQVSEFDQELIRQFAVLLGKAIGVRASEAVVSDGNSYYEALFINSPAAVVVMKQDGTVERINKEFSKLFLYDSEEISGKNIDEILPASGERLAAQKLTNRILEGERISQEGIRYRKDGTAVYVSIIAVRSTPPSKEPLIYSIYHDITERVLAQERLKESQARFRLLFESANDAIFLLREGIVVECNPRTLEIFRCTSEEIIGKSALEMSPKRQANGSLSINKAVKYFRAAMGHEQQTFEWTHRRPDGSQFVAEVSINVFDWKGESYTQAIVRDISRRKQTEELLKQRFEFIAFISRISAEMINPGTDSIDQPIREVLAYSANYTSCSRAVVYQLNSEGIQFQLSHIWDKENITSASILDQVLISDLPGVFSSISEGKTLVRDVPEVVTSTEESLLVEVLDMNQYKSFILVPLAVGGKIIGLSVYFSSKCSSDWTDDLLTPLRLTNQLIANAIERKKTEVELRSAKEKAVESDKLKTAFLSSMSHEIRTPMNHILGFIELLKDPSLSESEKYDFMSIVKSSGNLLLKLIDDIIDIAKLESGQLTLSELELDMSKFLEGIQINFNEQLKTIGKHKIDFRIQKPRIPVADSIKTDPLRLQQIVSNLLSNALKFTQHGLITFGYSLEPDNKLHFFVEDTGIGIPEENHSEVFERFRQLDGSYAREYSGTGLGLAISKGLVELLNGEIGLESQPGKGSRFYFTIPYIPVKPISHAIGVKPVSSGDYNFNGKSILVVEDDEINYRFLEIVIHKTKARALRALTGKQAVDICMSENIDLVLMDIQIPVMDGYTATAKIKELKPDLPIIAQTAHALAEEKEKCLRSGADDYLAKPISRKDLLIKMAGLLLE